MVSPALSSPPERNLVFADELADVLEADRGLKHGLAVKFRDGVDHLRGRHAARRGHFPAAGFHQVVVDEREDEIGLDPGSVAIDDAEAIGVAVGGQARGCFESATAFRSGARFSSRDVGPRAVEEAVALRAHGAAR